MTEKPNFLLFMLLTQNKEQNEGKCEVFNRSCNFFYVFRDLLDTISLLSRNLDVPIRIRED